MAAQTAHALQIIGAGDEKDTNYTTGVLQANLGWSGQEQACSGRCTYWLLAAINLGGGSGGIPLSENSGIF